MSLDPMEQSFDLSGGAAAQAPQKQGRVNSEVDLDGEVFDLEGVDENTTYELLPQGTYNAIVEEMSFGPSSNGNAMISLQYSVTDAEYENRKLFDFFVLNGGQDNGEFGKKKLKKFLARVCPEIPLNGFKPSDFCEKGLGIGRALQVVVKIQTQKKGDYKGQKRNTVADLLSPAMNGFM